MVGNQGRAAHDHAFTALQLLYQYHWDIPLMCQVRDELQKAVDKLGQHLSRVKCPCGDQLEDVQFYASMRDEINWSIQMSDLSPVPVVQESLQDYLTNQEAHHLCIYHLMQGKHHWVGDVG